MVELGTVLALVAVVYLNVVLYLLQKSEALRDKLGGELRMMQEANAELQQRLSECEEEQQ